MKTVLLSMAMMGVSTPQCPDDHSQRLKHSSNVHVIVRTLEHAW